MFNVRVTYEGKKSAEVIQQKFKQHLSQKDILKTTAGALNDVAKRVKSSAKQEIRDKYTVKAKYLKKMTSIKFARPTHGGLYAELSYNFKSVPLSGFYYKDLNKSGKKKLYGKMRRGVEVEIIRGKSQILRHVFVQMMPNGHVGVWASGYYKGKRFVPAITKTSSGKRKITEYKTTSPFRMATSPDIAKRLLGLAEQRLPSTLEAMLRAKANSIVK